MQLPKFIIPLEWTLLGAKKNKEYDGTQHFHGLPKKHFFLHPNSGVIARHSGVIARNSGVIARNDIFESLVT